jgi:hypothetical protein
VCKNLIHRETEEWCCDVCTMSAPASIAAGKSSASTADTQMGMSVMLLASLTSSGLQAMSTWVAPAAGSVDAVSEGRVSSDQVDVCMHFRERWGTRRIDRVQCRDVGRKVILGHTSGVCGADDSAHVGLVEISQAGDDLRDGRGERTRLHRKIRDRANGAGMQLHVKFGKGGA